MNRIFDPALRLLLRHEGGYVNHPADPGGMTNLGVTKKAWEAYKGHPISETEMRNLTANAVTPFYKTKYWDAIKGDDLPAGVDYCVFDTCVNSGVGRAVKLLQEALGISIDGSLGPATLLATSKQPAHATIAAFTTGRLAYLESLPTWPTFGKGWKRRVEEVEQEAITFAKVP